MKLIVPILLNCLLVLGVYLADKYTPAKKLPYMTKQVIIGLLFGGASAFASSYGVEWLGAVVNVRDAAPLSAGLIFGAPAGIISGCIGGFYRWFSVYWGGGMYTRVACSIATILAGFMAAGLRKLMFDNKKPLWSYGISIAVVCEVIHMIMIFVTNMDNSSYAFEFVQGATLPMVLGNAVAVGVSIIIVSLLSHEGFIKNKNNEKIANTFQRWLLAGIVIAYAVTSTFTFILQNGIVQIETQEVFTTAITDTESDIRGRSDDRILSIAEQIKMEYEGQTATLDSLKEKYQIAEINVFGSDGAIIDSTEKEDINNESVIRKYVTVKLSGDGFVLVGYDAEQFNSILNEIVIDVIKNRHVGTNGFVVVCDNELNLVTDSMNENPQNVSSIGIVPPQEMLDGKTASTLYYAEVVDNETGFSVKYMYVFKFVEGYCIIAAIPEAEATFMRDASLYTSIFMQVLIFAGLFVFIYILIKKVVITNIKKINDTLRQITEGDLNLTVDVRSNEEFSSLSDDINSTVATLKRYIAEAAARIDKELEYAKQIQLSALPTNFPMNEECHIYAQMIAAKEVGGDFYDFYKINDSTMAFLAADVSGKGIPAAMFMMTAKTIIKDLAESGMAVNEIFTKANEKLCENNESGMFVTAWMGILDLNTGVLHYANAGHNPPLLKRSSGEFEYLKTRAGFVLAGMEGIRYRMGELNLSSGDRLFLYTDGVTEATNTNNQLYGEERLITFMNQNSDIEATALLPALKNNIDEFVGEAPQFDDITMLMFDYKPQKGSERMTTKTFPAKTAALSDVLGFVDEKLQEFECPMKTQMAICVAIEEVFVNIAHYAYGEGEGDMTLGIGFDESERIVSFSMADSGTPFDPLKKPDPDITLSAEEREVGGLGIFITKKTMDSLSYSYENGKNILTMNKKI